MNNQVIESINTLQNAVEQNNELITKLKQQIKELEKTNKNHMNQIMEFMKYAK